MSFVTACCSLIPEFIMALGFLSLLGLMSHGSFRSAGILNFPVTLAQKSVAQAGPGGRQEWAADEIGSYHTWKHGQIQLFFLQAKKSVIIPNFKHVLRPGLQDLRSSSSMSWVSLVGSQLEQNTFCTVARATLLTIKSPQSVTFCL